jgi:hypothetical protein
MSQVAIITDSHFGARNDSVPLMNCQQKFFEKVFFPTLDKYGVKEIYHGGDYTDRRKYVAFGTVAWVYQNYRIPIQHRDIHETILVGNHDCFLKHSTSINSVTELYRDTKGVTIITQPSSMDLDGHEILLLPWICDENRDTSLKMIADSKSALVFGHLELAGFQMYSGLVSTDGLPASLFDKFKLVMSGHFHHRSTGGPIQYLGAPYAMTWSDFRDPRGFHLFDTQTHELTFIENPYSLFSRIVYNDEGQKHAYINDLCQRVIAVDSPYREAYVKVVVQKKTQPFWFDLLMDSLFKVQALDVQVVDDLTIDDGVSFDDGSVTASLDTVALMRDFVDSLNINCEKEALKTRLQFLYFEALAANASQGMS